MMGVADTTARLLDLYARDGKLTAETVLDDAYNPNSPLHAQFEWDDTVAAHQYRLVQARQIIRGVQVSVMERPVRQYVFITSTDSYHPIETVIASKDWAAEMVDEFKRDAARFEARWANHQHVAAHYKAWKRAH